MLDYRVSLPVFHADQVKLFWRRDDDRALGPSPDPAWAQNSGGRFRAVRCGRRYGKTTFLQGWLGDIALKGQPAGYFAPTYKYVSEAYEEMFTMLEPVLRRRGGHTKGQILRLRTGGSIEFWTLEDERAGRSRKYRRVALDEAAFTKNGSALKTWRESIKPSLGDLRGTAIAASNTNGIDPSNLLYALCNDPKHEFIEHHAPAWANPHVPIRLPGQSFADWLVEQQGYYDNLRAREHPLVFAQEYAAEFVDWSGVSLFDMQKLLVDGAPVEFPTYCDAVFATADTSTKAEKDNDGTAVCYWALMKFSKAGYHLVLLDWDLIQVEGALLETWLPVVQQNLEALAVECRAGHGSVGGWIEDKDSGQVLLQQARLKGLPFQAIDSSLTALGKDARALAISGHIYRGEVKLSRRAYEKRVMYKGVERNHLISQVTGFKMADPDASRRADDAFDAFAYGVSIGLGDSDGW